jgi:hypothetical protein
VECIKKFKQTVQYPAFESMDVLMMVIPCTYFSFWHNHNCPIYGKYPEVINEEIETKIDTGDEKNNANRDTVFSILKHQNILIAYLGIIKRCVIHLRKRQDIEGFPVKLYTSWYGTLSFLLLDSKASADLTQ